MDAARGLHLVARVDTGAEKVHDVRRRERYADVARTHRDDEDLVAVVRRLELADGRVPRRRARAPAELEDRPARVPRAQLRDDLRVNVPELREDDRAAAAARAA